MRNINIKGFALYKTVSHYIKGFALYKTVYFLRYTHPAPDIYEKFAYKLTETTEYV